MKTLHSVFEHIKAHTLGSSSRFWVQRYKTASKKATIKIKYNNNTYSYYCGIIIIVSMLWYMLWIKNNLTFSDTLVQIIKYFFFIYVTYHLTHKLVLLPANTEDRTCFAGSILLKAACVCFNFCLVWVQPLKRVSTSSQLCIPLSEQKTPAAAITCSFSPSVCGPAHKHTGGTKASGGILI